MNHSNKWRDTQWRKLDNDRQVNVIDGDELAVIRMCFVDSRENSRDFPLALNGRVISHIEVDGVRYVRAPEHVESCEVVD